MKTETTPSASQLEALLGPDPLSEALRGRIREVILELVEAELTEVLAARPYERSDKRCGYRNGSDSRNLTTGLGSTRITLPRARVFKDDSEKEWQSKLVARYQRRAPAVDAALIGAYLSGANQRRIKGALAPLLRGAPMSKSAVSRVVGRMSSLFEEWRKRRLADEPILVCYLDAIALRVRLDKKVVSVPVLVALGVRRDGTKVVLDLELMTSESTECWKGLMAGMVARGLSRPRLCVIDGCPGLRAAVAQIWPEVPVQRCAVHKLRNLERHVPRHALEEVRTDYHRITEADSLAAARVAYHAFIAKWSKRAPKVAESLAEAGEELLTFYRFPKTQWKSLRTTNMIERLNEEFRRRVKTHGPLPNAKGAELLLFGLLISEQIRVRRIDGWNQLDQIPQPPVQTAA